MHIVIEPGRRFGGYTVIERRPGKRALVRCDCGDEQIRAATNLPKNQHGCWRCSMRARRGSEVGRQYHAWLVLVDDDPVVGAKRGGRKVLARCTKCNTEHRVHIGNLKHGLSKGCTRCAWAQNGLRARKENAPSRHPLFSTWQQMNRRCDSPSHVSYRNYGARGITVCDRWRESFANFLADMGDRPSTAHSLDRINNDGHYEPGNCRWATRRQQARNTRRSKLLAVGGELLTLQDAGDRIGLTREGIRQRILAGWTQAEAAATQKWRLPPRLAAMTDRRRRGRAPNLYVDGSRTVTIAELSAETGISRHVLYARLRSGESVARACRRQEAA